MNRLLYFEIFRYQEPSSITPTGGHAVTGDPKFRA